MIINDKIFIGKANNKEIYLLTKMLNRHGLITGATGTGKTITMKVIAEKLSDLGIPSFITDIKGDVSSLAKVGDERNFNRANKLNLNNFNIDSYPVCFFDIYNENGHPLRSTIEDMGSVLLSNILELSVAQEGVLAIAFKVAKDLKMQLIDLKDLKSCLNYISEHNKELMLEYGNITKQSVASILRNILVLEQEGGDLFFNEPKFEIADLFRIVSNKGLINILDCQKLFQKPKLYATFLIWILSKLYNELDEVGDLEKPKIVLFFDEAHLIFDNPSKILLTKLQQVIKLIRSKGVGIFFCTQNQKDIDDVVLSQLSNRLQHALRAYSVNEIKAVKAAANSFRSNPNFNTIDKIISLEKGEALISSLDEKGIPLMVESTMIFPPKSSFDTLDFNDRIKIINSSSIYNKYKDIIDKESAFEDLKKIKQNQQQQLILEKERQELEKEKNKLAKEKEKLLKKEHIRKIRQQEIYQERQIRRKEKYIDKTINSATNSIGKEIVKSIFKVVKNLLK